MRIATLRLVHRGDRETVGADDAGRDVEVIRPFGFKDRREPSGVVERPSLIRQKIVPVELDAESDLPSERRLHGADDFDQEPYSVLEGIRRTCRCAD